MSFSLSSSALATECWFCKAQGDYPAHSDTDPRHFCAKCLKTNVFTDEQASPLRWEVESYMTELFGNARYQVTFKMYDQAEFEKFRERARLGPSTDGIYMNRERTVYMRSGLGPGNFQALLAHESTHGWQQQFCPNQDRGLVEGFASLVQHKFMLRKGMKYQANALEKDGDADYGASLVALLKKEKQMGLYPLIEKVQRCKKLAEVMAN